MKANPLKDGTLTKNSVGLGTVTPEMVQKRTIEVAIGQGRTAKNVLKSDWEQAKQELTGGSDPDPKQAVLESAPESQRWDPLPGSPGYKKLPTPSEDEDAEGRSDNQRLVEEGITAAEDNQERHAIREAKKRDKRP